jgi:hypothetical protein
MLPFMINRPDEVLSPFVISFFLLVGYSAHPHFYCRRCCPALAPLSIHEGKRIMLIFPSFLCNLFMCLLCEPFGDPSDE